MSRKTLFIFALVLATALVVVACRQSLPEGCPPDCAGQDLYQIKLGAVDLSNADFSNADLSRANLIGANLSGANLTGAGLRYADLRNANLRGANLTKADARFTRLAGADFTGANLTDTNLLLFTRRPSTNWPEGFDYKAAGAVLAPED